MPTETNMKECEFFVESNQSGEFHKIGTANDITINSEELHKDDAVDTMRFCVNSINEITEQELTIPIPKQFKRTMQIVIGEQTITRKRFKKLLMGYGLQRNEVEKIIKIVRNNNLRYTPNLAITTLKTVIDVILTISQEEGA